MKKTRLTQDARRLKILEMISEQLIGTQSELSQSLAKEGYEVTQATLSRDIRELGLAKFRNNNGENFYAIYDREKNTVNFANSYHQYVLSVSSVMFMVVCHTRIGEASLLANELDQAHLPEILGTIAGADTLLIVCGNIKSADDLMLEIKNAIK